MGWLVCCVIGGLRWLIRLVGGMVDWLSDGLSFCAWRGGMVKFVVMCVGCMTVSFVGCGSGLICLVCVPWPMCLFCWLLICRCMFYVVD